MGWQDDIVVQGNPKWMNDPVATASTTAAQPAQPASFGDVVAGLPITRLAMGAASPLIAAAQLGAHVGDKINEMTGTEHVVSPWIDKQLQAYDAAKKRGMKETGHDGFDFMGLLGNLMPAGKVATAATNALPQASSLGTRMLVGGTAGAATAAAQPVTSPDFWTSKASQAMHGAAFGSAIPLAAQTLMAGKAAVEPFYEKGREAIIGRTLNTASGGREAEVAQALATARELVPGSKPTVAQAAGNAGISSLDRAASAISPQSTVAANLREAEQNAARLKSLQTISGDDSAMAAAVQARKAAAAPLLQQVTDSPAIVDPSRTVSLLDKIIARSPGRTQLTTTLENVKKSLYEPHPLEQRGKEGWAKVSDALNTGTFGIKDVSALRTVRTVMDRVKNGRIDADEALTQLKGVSGKAQAVQDVIAETKALMKAPDQRLRSNASELYQGARKNITDLLNAKAGDGSKLNEAISRELSVVMKSLDHQINKAEPAYGNYLKTYAEQSKPINQMDVGREIETKAVNKLTGVLQPNAYANALSDKTAQQATGFKRATLEGTMTPEQMQRLQAIKDDVARAVQSQNNAGARGSDTVKKLAYSNLIDRAGIPTFLREFAPTQVAGNLLARGADSVYGRANTEIATKLAETLLNPQEAARMMRQVGPSRYAAIIDELMQRGAVAGGVLAGQTVNERK